MSYEDVDDEIWEKYFRTNVLAANGLAKYYLPEMLKNNFGRIVFMASEEAMMPSGQMPQYCMTKSMLLSLSKSLSKLTRGTEVTSNTIMPGPTLSEKVYQIIESMFPDDMAFSEKEKKFMAAHLPQSEIQRFIKPYEIDRLAAFVSSPYASAFKGSPIRMDGAWCLPYFNINVIRLSLTNGVRKNDSFDSESLPECKDINSLGRIAQ